MTFGGKIRDAMRCVDVWVFVWELSGSSPLTVRGWFGLVEDWRRQLISRHETTVCIILVYIIQSNPYKMFAAYFQPSWHPRPKDFCGCNHKDFNTYKMVTRQFSEWRFGDWQNGGQILTYWWFSDFSFWKKRPNFFSYPSRVSLKDFSYPLRVLHRKDSPHGVFLPLAGADF